MRCSRKYTRTLRRVSECLVAGLHSHKTVALVVADAAWLARKWSRVEAESRSREGREAFVGAGALLLLKPHILREPSDDAELELRMVGVSRQSVRCMWLRWGLWKGSRSCGDVICARGGGVSRDGRET